MLVVVDSPLASVDPGSLALALARCFGSDGPEVLLIDGNCAGESLAGRLGRVMNLNFSAGERGIPTLMVAAGETISAAEVRANCYRLDNPTGISPLLALAPENRRGAAAAVNWLDTRAEDLLELDEEFRVVVAASLKRRGAEAPVAILSRATELVVIAPASTDEQVEALADPFAGIRLPVVPGQRRMLLVEGETRRSDEELAEISSLEVLGSVPEVDDDRLLMPRRRLRRRLDSIAVTLDAGRRAAPITPRRSRRGRTAAPRAPVTPPPSAATDRADVDTDEDTREATS